MIKLSFGISIILILILIFMYKRFYSTNEKLADVCFLISVIILFWIGICLGLLAT